MPQVFIVVRCYSCNVFQVQQAKKVPKWLCKMCGQKQSLKKEYGRGSGADCRKHVQRLNMLKATTDNAEHEDEYARPSQVQSQDAYIEDHLRQQEQEKCQSIDLSVWSKFIDSTEGAAPQIEDKSMPSQVYDDNMITTDKDAVKGIRGAQKRHIKHYWGKKRKHTDEDELAENQLDVNQHLSLTNRSMDSTSNDACVYSSPEEPCVDRSIHVVNQSNKPTSINFKTIRNSFSKSNKSETLSDEGQSQFCLENSSKQTAAFSKEASRNREQKAMSFIKQGSTTASGSRWGQYLEIDDSAEDESCGDGLADDDNRNDNISERYQQATVDQCSHTYVKECVADELTATDEFHDETLLSSVNLPSTNLPGKLKEQPPAPKQCEYFKEQMFDHTPERSNRWNAFFSNNSSNTDNDVIHRYEYDRDNSLVLNKSGRNNPDACNSMRNKQDFPETQSVGLQMDQEFVSGEDADFQKKKTLKSMFSIEDHHLDEMFSDDW